MAGRRRAAFVGLTAAALALAGPADAAVRAVLVGIDDYAGPPPLRGAVNDVRDVAAVLGRAGVPVTVIENGAATREAVVAAVRAAAAASEPGDLVYLHFAGHGVSIADDDGDEPDGRDEAYLLQGFDETERPGEMLVDDDLDRLFASLGRDVLFVADACHSGSPTRAVAGPALPTRLYRPKAEPTRPPPPAGDRTGGDAGVYGLGATGDDRSIPEILIDGEPRGALSFATARALEGGADFDRDGRVGMREFETYVRQAVRTLAASKQTPQFAGPDDDRTVMDVAGGAAPSLSGPADGDGLEPVSVHVLPGAGRERTAEELAGLPGVRLGESAGEATLLVDPASGAVMNAVRDVIADGGDLDAVVTAERVRAALAVLARDRPPTISLSPGDDVLPAGTRIGFEVDGLRHPHLTVVDLTASGTVHWLWPLTADDPDPWPAGRGFSLDAEVSPPFGADTLVVIASERAPDALRAMLAAIDGERRPLAFHQALAEARRRMGVQVGLQAFVTGGSAP